jgi:hypothetical protein
MPVVTIRIHAPLSEKLGLARGGRRAILDQSFEPGARVRDVFSRLAEQYPPFRTIALEPGTDRLVPHILLTVDGQLITAPDGYDRPLKEQDEIAFLHAARGG